MQEKMFLILDNLRVRHRVIVKAWVAEWKAQTSLCYLLSYGLQFNIDVRINAKRSIKQFVAMPEQNLFGRADGY